MKILIFGADGFIGKNLQEGLKKYNLDCPLISECNLLMKQQVEDKIKKANPDFIINAAYIGVDSKIRFSKNYAIHNITIITNIIEASTSCKNLKKIITFGSGLEYGDSKEAIDESFPLNPKNIYASIKAMGSILSIALAKELQVPLILIRPFNLYGPWDKKSVIYYIVDSVLKSKEIYLTKGEQIRDYLYISDLVKFIEKIFLNHDKFKNYEIFNLGSGQKIKMNQLFKIIFDLMNVNPKIEQSPYRKNDYFYQVADIKKAKNSYNWKPQIEIKEGLMKTITWIKANY